MPYLCSLWHFDKWNNTKRGDVSIYMESCKDFTNDLLKRKYYENDDSLYKNGINLRCLDLAKREGLRAYDVDEFLVFCEDINIEFSMQAANMYFGIHSLNFNSEFCKYCCVTKKFEEAEESIKQILKNGEPVIFKTALGCLKSFSWYQPEGPYTVTNHWSIIIGYDQYNYFYVDVPITRNYRYFRQHPDNPAVGCLAKNELYKAFRYYCEIGYIKVNMEHIKDICSISQIVSNIVNNYYCEKGKDSPIYIGKQALEKMMVMLKKNPNTSSFVGYRFEVLASRHELLKHNLLKYRFPLEEKEKCIDLLDELVCKWRVVKYLHLKKTILNQSNIEEKIVHVLEEQIFPMTENLMRYFELSLKKHLLLGDG